MQRLEVSGAVRPMYGSLGVKRLITIGLHVSTVIRSSSGRSQRLQVTGSCEHIWIPNVFTLKHKHFTRIVG